MRRILSTLLLALCLHPCAAVHGMEVFLLSSLQDEHHERYRQALADALASAGAGLSGQRLPAARSGERAAPSASLPESASLVIAAGARACARALTLPRPPVLCTFVSRQTYQRLIPATRAAQHTALYLEQPLERRFNLARLLLPPRTGLSVLLAADSDPAHAQRLEAAAQATGVSLSILRPAAERNPASLIQQRMDRGQMLLALPDPDIYNRHTIHGILLTTYRKGIAVIGFSESFVTAGAIAAVHSTPEDLAADTAEMADGLLADSDAGLPLPVYPSRFSVSLNRRVAHSLNIHLPPKAQLEHELLDMESGTR